VRSSSSLHKTSRRGGREEEDVGDDEREGDVAAEDVARSRVGHITAVHRAAVQGSGATVPCPSVRAMLAVGVAASLTRRLVDQKL
jgi:hypothetical protein